MNLKKLQQSLKLPRRTLNIIIILATLSSAVYYFYNHHSLITDLKHISPYVALEVFGLYVLMLGVLVVIYTATMRLVNIKMPLKENSLINTYSLFMNFFIPGQTGPAFRAYYMKKNYKLKYLNYTLATIVYYLVYGVLSVIFVIAGSQRYYITLPA
ncbi:MAG TPA: lysylphosphatidylglycerol synthase domain-containing protein, partial [Candidatus Saccharimonadales bacterium]